MHEPRKFQHDRNAAGAVVGAHHGLAPVGGIGVVVGPGATVVVCADEQTCRCRRVGAGYDVACLERGAVITL